jgi:hypothetical protein
MTSDYNLPNTENPVIDIENIGQNGRGHTTELIVSIAIILRIQSVDKATCD